MGFPRQLYWSGLPCPPPGDLPNPGIKPRSPVSSASQVDSLPLSHEGSLSLTLLVYKIGIKTPPLWEQQVDRRGGNFSALFTALTQDSELEHNSSADSCYAGDATGL